MIGRRRGASAQRGAIAAIAAIGLAGCGDRVARIELVVDGCGRTTAATTVTVTGLAESGAFAEELLVSAGEVSLGAFPPDLRQITVEARDAQADLVVHGKTAPFVVATTPQALPIAVAPPDGLCPVGDLLVARRNARVVPVGPGALVFGGLTGAATSPDPVAIVEYFDPATSTFVDAGSFGATLGANAGGAATLADGRIVVLGGADGGYAFFDPVARQLGQTLALFARPHAAVLGLDNRRMLVAGGCSSIAPDGVTCNASLPAVTVLDVDLQDFEDLPDLEIPRAGGLAVFVPRAGGGRDVALVGGFDPVTRAPVTEVEIVSLAGSGTVARIPGAPGLTAVLDSGGVLAALAPPGAPGASSSAVFVPGLTPARPTGFTAPRVRRDAVLVALEDGTVLAIGGFDQGSPDVAGAPLLFQPLDGWRLAGSPPPDALIEHGAARLADGSVLIVGGRDLVGDAATAAAWRYRPSLLGPFAGAATATPDSGLATQLTALDPTLIDRSDGYALVATAAVDNYALVGGPRFANGSVDATVTLRDTGGLALIARATGTGDRVEAILEPTALPRVVRWTAGVATTVCTGTEVVPALAGTAGVRARLEIDGETLTLSRVGAPRPDLASCNLGPAATPGLWGVAAIGGAAGSARLEVQLVSVQR